MSAGDDRSPPGAADGGETDAWLRAALRHAPDAQVGAPPALSAAILREAMAAPSGVTRRPAPPGVWQQFLAAWSWLARPPVAAGFASVMLASVIGLMWWDKPLTETLPARAPEVAVVPSPPVAAAQVESAVASKGATDSSNAMLKREAAPAGGGATPTAQSAELRRVAPGAALGKARAAVSPPAPEPSRRESTGALADAAPTFDLPEARLPATSHTPPAPVAAVAAAPAAITADAASKLGARSRELRLSAATAPLLNELRAAIRAEPQRWTWQRGAGAEQAMTTALRAWLDRVDDGSMATDTAPASATELRLLRDGQLHTTLALGAAGLRVSPADARRAPQHLALSPEAAAELKTALDIAAP